MTITQLMASLKRATRATYNHIYPKDFDYTTVHSCPELTALYVLEFNKLNHFKI